MQVDRLQSRILLCIDQSSRSIVVPHVMCLGVLLLHTVIVQYNIQ